MRKILSIAISLLLVYSCSKESVETTPNDQQTETTQTILRTGGHGRIGCVVVDDLGHPVGSGTKCINVTGECPANSTCEKHTLSLQKNWHNLSNQDAETYAIDYADELRNAGRITTQAEWNEVKAVYKAYLLTL